MLVDFGIFITMILDHPLNFTNSNIVRHKMGYKEFKDFCYAYIGVEKTSYKLIQVM